jgi:hypothetical protein
MMNDPQPALHAIARIHGEPLLEMPLDLYIPPDALELVLETFQGPLDLLLYLIRKHNLDVLDIPMAELTRQYMGYIEMMHQHRLELAAEYSADGGGADRDQIAHAVAASAQSQRRGRRRPARRTDAPFARIRADETGRAKAQ